MSKKKKYVEYCLRCKSKQEFIPIVYGYPSQELMKKAEAGEVLLGGCMLWDRAPMHKCKKCGLLY
jgi:hypothetical protein